MQNTIIDVEGLVKRYGDFPAVDDVSFSMERGQCLAILGPNGAGKTTTVEILEGFRSPAAGAVTVLGVTPRTAGRQWHNRVGIVLQSVFNASTLKVREELQLAATSYSNPRPVDEVLELVGLSEKATSRVGKLSGGQRRRLDVALGIIGRPELLFLDEPTTGFDPTARHSFWEMIEGLRLEDTSVLLTTHYLDEAARLADRVLVMAKGKIVAEGTPESLGGPRAHLPRVRWTDDKGRTCEKVSADPTAEVIALSREMGGVIRDLEVIRPTLEDVYLQLVGEKTPEGHAA
ncbi:ABC transporter ATP-binding protein [Actinomycetaceae bacterium WB03_NA08]|uniref:ABC transporter ATP-binding protein n=1 Tax=Scrofimicrobium canadense TaxID=2652290 RepID=A0A6N7W4H0_9ACTO|nr:ABC transporter ATP-binding protein [Scrofimicrobium canadense]MSS84205.1 ABC transporter ATP-binding protein [Scrofimicrobium canadense]